MAELSSEWLAEYESKPAPDPLRLVQALINTRDLDTGEDRLAERAEATRWLTANHLLEADDTLTPDDLHTVVEVREALRAMTVQNAGGPAPTPEKLAPLRNVAAGNLAQAHLDADGIVQLTPAATSVRAKLLGVLLIVRDAQRDGSWEHLKACGNDDCLWAFYDRSRNHGGTWCDMASCGNKLKNREFRARKRGD
ncbi:MAG: CGNR zinc finger domain-containing protein [Mycobacterium sp.]